MIFNIRRSIQVAAGAVALSALVLAPVARLNSSVAQAAKIRISYIVWTLAILRGGLSGLP